MKTTIREFAHSKNMTVIRTYKFVRNISLFQKNLIYKSTSR